MNGSRCCRQCRFWLQLHPDDLYPAEESQLIDGEAEGDTFIGECRRHPPTVDGMALHQLGSKRMKESGYGNDDLVHAHLWQASHWPMTYETDWCGAYRPVRRDQ